MKRLSPIFFKKLLTGGLVVAMSFTLITPASPVSAETKNAEPANCDEAFYARNDVLLFNPCSTTCSTNQVSVQTDKKLEKTAMLDQIYEYLTKTSISTNDNKPLSPAQAAGVMGNMEAESSFNPSAIEATTRAEKGHGLIQWTFGRWHNLEAFANEQGKAWDDVQVQLDFLKKELEGSERGIFNDLEFKNANDPTTAAVRWRIVFERADPKLAHDDRRIGSAIAVYNMYGGQAGSCQAKSAAVAGDIVKTAINLATQKPVEEGKINKNDARDNYQTEMAKIDSKGDWSDGALFIATVMISSKVDSNYPKNSVASQLNYTSNSKNYLVQEVPSIETLKPGDILFTNGQTAIYTGESSYPMIDASLGKRVPGVRDMASLQAMMNEPSIRVVRPVKP